MNDSNENITEQIAREESFVTPELTKKDPNAVYIEDNPQKALEKLRNLSANESYAEKVQYVKHLAELMSIIGDEGITYLRDIIVSIQDDTDEIKKALLSQVTPLVSFLRTREAKGYQEIIDIIVPTVSHLVNYVNYDIKEEAGQELAKIAPILNEDDRGKHLLTVVLGMAHDDENEENRMIAVRLLSEMAPLFGKDLCEQFVGLEFLSMGEDPQLRVRKEAVSNLPAIGKIVSAYFFRQRLLPFYLKLCKDTNWGVRKSCIDTIYEISNICKEELTEIRENELTEAMNNFIKDPNKWVKISAYKSLGPFIYTLDTLKINEKLIESYLHMADANINNLSPDNEIIYACAYNFPAVLLTLGASKWSLLSKLFQSLLKSNDRMRKPLACSLHEIAKIIGQEKTEKDLLSVLEGFLKDPNDDIKYGAIQNLAMFLKVFDTEKRENMVDIFVQLQKDQKKWRIRELIARQIDKLTLIFSPKITFEIIAPISFKLCNDPVSFVRDEAARKIYSILKVLYDSNDVYKESIIENIKGFSLSNRFTNRQSFVSMCEKIMKNADMFMNHFYVYLLPLVNDKVPNVRIAVAKILDQVFKKKSKRSICQRTEILQIVKKMREDTSRDVKNHIDAILKDLDVNLEEIPDLVIPQQEHREVKPATTTPPKAEESKMEEEVAQPVVEAGATLVADVNTNETHVQNDTAGEHLGEEHHVPHVLEAHQINAVVVNSENIDNAEPPKVEEEVAAVAENNEEENQQNGAVEGGEVEEGQPKENKMEEEANDQIAS